MISSSTRCTRISSGDFGPGFNPLNQHLPHLIYSLCAHLVFSNCELLAQIFSPYFANNIASLTTDMSSICLYIPKLVISNMCTRLAFS
jgi:hypothetical protein